MSVDITKIQFLSARDTGHPIFYCHAEDEGHTPKLSIAQDANTILVVTGDTLFKVKANPQRKNRVDIYMSIESANALGHELLAACAGVAPSNWPVSNTNPYAVASGRMALPNIEWSRSGRFLSSTAVVRSGTRMEKRHGTLYVELETPVANHIRMKTPEIHIGMALDLPTGQHDRQLTTPVDVPDGELQRGTDERNPIYKVVGTLSIQLDKAVAAGLGQLLQATTPPV